MKAKYSLDDLRYFCIIAKLSSFKKAAKILNIPLSTLSRRVRQLETDLQLRLLERNAHRVTLTHIGEQYYARYKGLFEQVDNIELDLDNEKNQAKGRIRVTAPIYLGQQILSEIFCDFLAEYPNIQLDLRFSNDLIDIEALGIDVAFRVRNSTIDNWVARELKLTGNILCCNAAIDLDYLVRPEQLNDVKKVICIGLKPWQLENSSTGEQYQYNPEHQICLETDEIQMMINAVKAGLGVSYVPDYIAYPLIKQGKLKQILPEWKSAEQVISILYRDRVNIPLRVRLLIEYVLKRLH